MPPHKHPKSDPADSPPRPTGLVTSFYLPPSNINVAFRNPTPTSSDRLQTAKEDQTRGRRPSSQGKSGRTPSRSCRCRHKPGRHNLSGFESPSPLPADPEGRRPPTAQFAYEGVWNDVLVWTLCKKTTFSRLERFLRRSSVILTVIVFKLEKKIVFSA